MKLVIGNDPELIGKARKIRHSVFVTEQGIPSQLDSDGLDDGAYHALMTQGDDLVGTARLTLVSPTHATLARVSIMSDFRGQGLSTTLISSLVNKAKELNLNRIEIHAHKNLKHYYESLDFSYIKDAGSVAEHPLIEMHLKLNPE
ncbi:MAG: GNAT family N-acetyltransferase [Moritella sp.]|uniref:GNAT family N-acetyltransferase n=1 Tax=unclassified Moritella TaxID=2637987 RepID=UPI00015682D2|nr:MULTISPECIES: GNAT family N-acetyltransferase [unclassified Moritella]EDM67844.1 acetyltransferase, GNAT family [Moritella sp. PE36]MBL1415379.1 GNAT family N-acetyltransferase [Moritella sp.]PHR87524.1 MAG: GNAT family N-acetyltransferase [Moritella sp.]